MSPKDNESKRLKATINKAKQGEQPHSSSRNRSVSTRTTTNSRRNSAKRDKERKSSGFEGGGGAENCSNLNEMATTDASFLLGIDASDNKDVEQETNLMDGDKLLIEEEGEESSETPTPTPALATAPSSSSASPNKNNDLNKEPLPPGWEQHIDNAGLYYWHVATGVIQRTRPVSSSPPRRASLVFYHDDEEINQTTQRTSSGDDDDEYYDGAALTMDDTSESTFVVYPLGCCDFDETQLVAATSSKAIQKCILRLSNKPANEDSLCWGLDQSQPILMKLFDDHIQFTDINTQTLLRSQPIQTIRSWAVDDDNNFAFVIEDRQCHQQQHHGGDQSNSTDYFESVEEALLGEPSFMCYVFRSLDDDDMSCKVAAKLNEEITRYKEHMMNRMTKSTRVQQMVEQPVGRSNHLSEQDDDEDDFDDELEASNEVTLNVKYIGSTPVPRPTGIDVLNVAIDKCLAEASKTQINNTLAQSTVEELEDTNFSPLIDAKLHISPSSVIVENVVTGEIIVECRIRYLTFIGISKRDIRWCGFMMQNSTNKTFRAHCFECHPTAGHVCEAIQMSCSRMFEKVKKNARQSETISIVPTSSKIRLTLAKTFSRIKLNPIK